jgi:hypothetical protein
MRNICGKCKLILPFSVVLIASLVVEIFCSVRTELKGVALAFPLIILNKKN